jgi:hypothetical protein
MDKLIGRIREILAQRGSHLASAPV